MVLGRRRRIEQLLLRGQKRILTERIGQDPPKSADRTKVTCFRINCLLGNMIAQYINGVGKGLSFSLKHCLVSEVAFGVSPFVSVWGVATLQHGS